LVTRFVRNHSEEHGIKHDFVINWYTEIPIDDYIQESTVKYLEEKLD